LTHGRQQGVIWHPSPNVNARRGGALPDIVVLHHTAMATAEVALQRLCDPEPPEGLSPVSCHYLIGEAGQIWQMVDEADRGWHAGVGQWGDVTDVNSRSVGIELANSGSVPFAEAQMARLEWLLPQILQRWDIPAERVIGHSDMAPLRKFDPGARFDWRRLALRGLSVWPDETAEHEADFFESLQRFGYPDLAEDAPEDGLLRAFRLRFRPWAEGPENPKDRIVAGDLARRFPVRAG
jgi:N-acetylmuramoyl-L-alanine amidase